MLSRDFPNCFIMSPSQGGFTVNYPHMLDELAIHIAHIISHALDNDIATVEATEEAEQLWVDAILEKGTGAPIGGEGCTPGYYNNEGKPGSTFAQAAAYGEGSIAFFNILKQWREAGDFEGVEFGR
jgi:cyclohexanone monooxygenase